VSLDLDGNPNTILGPHGIRVIHQSDKPDYCSAFGIADRPVGARDVVLFGGEDITSDDSSIRGVEIVADRLGPSCPFRACRFYDGTSGADKMKGTRGRDVMLGKGGNDVLNASAGNNVMNGGPGVDVCRGRGRRISCEKR
jgi:Ca2+-binding RTX toxin-like protein